MTDTQITETDFQTGFYSAEPFNGFVITDLTSSNITGVSIDPATNVPGFDASDLSYTSDSVSINIAGLTVPSATNEIVIDVGFVATPTVPEPASLTLLGTALLGFGAIRHRRRA